MLVSVGLCEWKTAILTRCNPQNIYKYSASAQKIDVLLTKSVAPQVSVLSFELFKRAYTESIIFTKIRRRNSAIVCVES